MLVDQREDVNVGLTSAVGLQLVSDVDTAAILQLRVDLCV